MSITAVSALLIEDFRSPTLYRSSPKADHRFGIFTNVLRISNPSGRELWYSCPRELKELGQERDRILRGL